MSSTLAALQPPCMVPPEHRRKNATREVTAPLKHWLNEHLENPYPTMAEKTMLAVLTRMTMTQVSTWFANARRHLKKENQMTWSPRHRPNDEDDDEDGEGGDGSIMANQQRHQQSSGEGDTVQFAVHNKPGASNVKCSSLVKCLSTTLLCCQLNSPPPSSIQQGKTNGKKKSGKIGVLFNCFSRKYGSQANAVQVKEEADQNSPLKVFEQIKANQEQIQEAMSKMQIQITKYGESLATYENMMKITQDNTENNVVGYNGKFTPIRKTIRLEIKDCKDLFKKAEGFSVSSESIEVFRFGWYLESTRKEKKCLALFLHARRPIDLKGPYRIEVDYRLSILNAFHAKDLVKESIGVIYDKSFGNGFWKMATFKDLLDPDQGFLRANGSIEVEVDFTIKASTLDHLV